MLIKMGNFWKSLIIIGVISIVVLVGWEVFQITTGGRSSFNLSVVNVNRPNLFSESLKKHLEDDPQRNSFVPDSERIIR